VQALYAAAARRGGVPCLWLNDIFARRLAPDDYQDENHLSSQASARVVDALLAAIETNLPPPRSPESGGARFDYVDATQARLEGPCRRRRLSSRVFDGDFIEISRGGRSFWAGDGRLVGLMLQSNEMSGFYAIRTRNRAYRKNPRSQMQEIVRNLMLLHYTTRNIAVDGEVEIAMPEDESRLMSLPEDGTLLAAPAIAPFCAQTLDIHGVMFWRPRKLSERLRDAFRRWRGRLARSWSVFRRSGFRFGVPKTRQNKQPEPTSDAIGAEKALPARVRSPAAHSAGEE
jgi:hypothetical protein